MNLKIIRGAFLNPFELQNYKDLLTDPKIDIEIISSKRPMANVSTFPVTKLWSPTDLPNFPFKFPILNRIFIDAQLLLGLPKKLLNTDIAHVAETYFGYTYQAIMAKRRGEVKKIISTVWETIPFNNQSLKGRKMIKKYALENIDHFVAVTQKAKACLLKEGIKENKITVIPMGVDLERFKPRSGKKNLRDVNILCVARLTTEKGIEDLVTAFLEIKKEYSNVRLTLIGNGPLKNEFHGIKNISIRSVPYSLIHNEYAKADIFCLPSRSTKTWEEQYGMCLVEAMASGLPIVSTKTGAIPEVCGEVAILGESHSVGNLKLNLEKLIYNKDLRDSLGKKGRIIAQKNYDCKSTCQKISSLYQKVLCR